MRSTTLVVWLAACCAVIGLTACGDDGGGNTDAGLDGDTDADADTDTDPLNCAGGRYDEVTGLCWQHPRASGGYSLGEATYYCDGINLGGHPDWYLPSRDDLIAILGGCDSSVLGGDSGQCNSCAESETCSILFGTDEVRYWSSTYSHAGDDCSYYWTAFFSTGYIVDDESYNDANNIRCVRLGP